MAKDVELSVVSPFLNEAESLPLFLNSLRVVLEALEISYEVVLVDDGSTDNWRETVMTIDWPACRVIELAGNSGHQAALDAGLRETCGTYVVTMDSDLQHPPSLLPDLLGVARSNDCDIVYARRAERREDTAFKRWSARAYYKVARQLTGVNLIENAADFRLMSRFVVDLLNSMPDRKVFRLLLPSLGFASETVVYEAGTRQAGEAKYTTRRMLGLALRSSIQFSRKPLRWVAVSGMLTSLMALLWLLYVLISWLAGAAITGWTSIMAVALLLGGAILFSLGVIGEYIGEIYETVKGRPSYIVRQVRGLQGSPKD